jgi:NAD(P)-dependent dehydrogenase (short-subunit alcohol dehydrogenase family)
MSRRGPTPADLLDLRGTVVVVTGAGGGIGSGIVERFLSAGASVVGHSHTTPLPTTGVEHFSAVQADLTEEAGPQTVVEAALAQYGRVDALINNAARQDLAALDETEDAAWRAMLEVNLTALHRLTQATARTMIERGGGGSIVHIASIEGVHPAPLHGHYSTSKAAVIMHAKAAAQIYGRHGIRVNAVSPGLIERPGLEEDWPDGVARWRAAAPLERLGRPEDVADACLFLCSPMAEWITGINLVVDGGVLTGPTW